MLCVCEREDCVCLSVCIKVANESQRRSDPEECSFKLQRNVCVCVCEHGWAKNKYVCVSPPLVSRSLYLSQKPPPDPPRAPCSTNHPVRESKLKLMGGGGAVSQRKFFSVAHQLKQAQYEEKKRGRLKHIIVRQHWHIVTDIDTYIQRYTHTNISVQVIDTKLMVENDNR